MQNDWTKWLIMIEFSNNDRLSKITKLILFFANKDFHPRITFESNDITYNFIQERLLAVKAENIINIIINIFKFMQSNVERFKKIMSTQINKYRKLVQYNFDDLIWLNNRNIKIIYFSKKLNDKMWNFYKMLKKKDASYKVKLSILIKIWNVFHFNLLKKNLKNLVENQIFEVFKSIETSKKDEWVMNDILDFKYYNRNKQL